MIIIVQWFKGTKASVKLLFTIQKKQQFWNKISYPGRLHLQIIKAKVWTFTAVFRTAYWDLFFYIYIRDKRVNYIGLWTPAAVYCFLLSYSGCKNIQTDRSLFVPTQQPGSLMLEPSVHSLCWFMNEYIRFWDNFFFLIVLFYNHGDN